MIAGMEMIDEAMMLKHISKIIDVPVASLRSKKSKEKFRILKGIRKSGGLHEVLAKVLLTFKHNFLDGISVISPLSDEPFVYKGFAFGIWTACNGKVYYSGFKVVRKCIYG